MGMEIFFEWGGGRAGGGGERCSKAQLIFVKNNF